MQTEDTDPALFWGTNTEGGTADHYGGRVHVVLWKTRFIALCGLPIEEIWEQRPPQPPNLCPLCCVRAMAFLFPAFKEVSPDGRRHRRIPVAPKQVAKTSAERTIIIPKYEFDSPVTSRG